MSARAAASKAPEAFRTIGEVADLLGVQTHVLRFWEGRFPQIRPVKGAGGRRYYRPADVALVSAIRWLLHDEGMTIRGVQKLMRDRGVRHVAALGAGSADVVVLQPAGSVDQPSERSHAAATSPTRQSAVRSRPARLVPPRADAEQLAFPGFPNDAPPADRTTQTARPNAVPTGDVSELGALYARLKGLRDRMANAQ
jgi:DNA-binding transcriptional MerR regulator